MEPKQLLHSLGTAKFPDTGLLAKNLCLLVDLNALDVVLSSPQDTCISSLDIFLKVSRNIALEVVRSLRISKCSRLGRRFNLLVDLVLDVVEIIRRAIWGATVSGTPLSRLTFQSLTDLNTLLPRIQTFIHQLADCGRYRRWIQQGQKSVLISEYYLKLATRLKVFRDAQKMQLAGRDMDGVASEGAINRSDASSISTIHLWDNAMDIVSREPMAEHVGAMTSVAVSPSDARYLVSGSRDGSIRLWDAKAGIAIGEPLMGHADEVTTVTFSPNGRFVASGSNDKTVRLWDSRRGTSYQPIEGHADVVTSVAFSPDGRSLVSGSCDRTVRLWDVATREQIGEPLKGHSDAVTLVGFSPDGSKIISMSADKTIYRWDTVTGVRVCTRSSSAGNTGVVTSMAASPDPVKLVSCSDDATLRIWYVSPPANIGKRICQQGPDTRHTYQHGSETQHSTVSPRIPTSPCPSQCSPDTIDVSSEGLIEEVRPVDLSHRVTIKAGPLTGGRFCDIYLGDLKTDTGTELVAMKQLRTFLSWNASQRASALLLFAREVELWSKFQHQFILPFCGFAIHNETQLFMISPWVNNGHCIEYLLRNPDMDRRRLLGQVADALHYLHSGGAGVPYVHGDIKGDNVLVSDEGNALLADFGLMRHVEAVSTVMATPSGIPLAGHLRFAAPELLVPEVERPSPASDVFAFACLLLQVFTGLPPFPLLRDPQVLSYVIQGTKPARPVNPDVVGFGLDDVMWDLANECWQREPSCRPTMREIVAKLR